MRVVWKKIEGMIKANAKHRKGFRLQEVSLDFVWRQLLDEIDELAQCKDSPEEMADVLAIAIHYCIKQGWTMEFMQLLIIEKLDKRFVKEVKNA